MKRILFVLLMFCTGSLFAFEQKVNVGDSPYYFSTESFDFIFYTFKKDYRDKKYYITEIVPVDNVCKVSMSNGIIFYVKKNEKVSYVSVDWWDENINKYEGTVKDFDYNYLVLDLQKAE